ncbi:sumo-activating enzyme subunit 2-like [Plasmopara halstedii]|uniref:SUMO-activating enzyme subunit n=1 Tax=Plasmopara halstedii TaxID=4781 RepID=A0A0P1AEI1_PLAHL|nr:sumo-activating enzyme subunit 2-like [Plasmopara halstedii]CEG38965.1 sumo-activating enzyme subunit 2-like [Plasmopara halstedii]|eukprot:XP_024575334.1 sumo-activating enzyme subunit 2-like [Plasmopara halstedii]
MTEELACVLGRDLRSMVQGAKILVVGAGGIGCELIKNLVLSGFEDIELIDLDTIDVSNLNRQFLFRSRHVGKSKALVAKEIAESFNSRAKIMAHHGNVKNSKFGLKYFEQFALVLNALDNVDARKHVNRLCLATNTPLIESGTTGYLGQVSVIKKGETECYECTPKVTQKQYPICTIRSTPEKMVHCIVWAKECYKLLFGKMEDSMLWEDPTNEEKSAFMDLCTRAPDMIFDDMTKLEEYACGVFRGLFDFEIKKRLEMNVYKTTAKSPKPLVLEEIVGPNIVQAIKLDSTAVDDKIVWNDRNVWSVAECVARFGSCIVRILHNEQSRSNLGSYEFDKDDTIAMEFVTAAANLRASVFSIAMESLYSCKGIAGNIIPAIATTNAIVAGFQVLEALRVLQAAKPLGESCKYTHCNRSWNARGELLQPSSLEKPNPQCYVCSKHTVELAVDTKRMLLRDLVDFVLKKKLGVNEPTISIGANTIYEEGEDAETSLAVNLDKKLFDLPGKGICHETIVSIEDFSQDFRCNIRVLHRDEETFGENATEVFALGGDIAELAADLKMVEAKHAVYKTSGFNSECDEDQMVAMVESVEVLEHKRRKVDGGESTTCKKAKSSNYIRT